MAGFWWASRPRFRPPDAVRSRETGAVGEVVCRLATRPSWRPARYLVRFENGTCEMAEDALEAAPEDRRDVPAPAGPSRPAEELLRESEGRSRELARVLMLMRAAAAVREYNGGDCAGSMREMRYAVDLYRAYFQTEPATGGADDGNPA